MLNIVVPMAGAGSRFANAGFKLPKPLIPVGNIPMIRLVIENVRPQRDHRFIFIVQDAHDMEHGLAQQLRTWAGSNAVVVRVDRLTDGAACTVLAAKDFVSSPDPLMIVNSDQWIDVSIDDYLDQADEFRDGLIMTMQAQDPKWSFLELDPQGHVTRVVEKEVISDLATVGIYNFTRGSDFVAAAKEMIAANERVNGEFYVAPVYNRLIRDGARVGTFSIGREANGMYGLGIPADLELFLNLPVCRKALAPFQLSEVA
jgi:dTDP-glucose pyrophosphorylase